MDYFVVFLVAQTIAWRKQDTSSTESRPNIRHEPLPNRIDTAGVAAAAAGAMSRC